MKMLVVISMKKVSRMCSCLTAHTCLYVRGVKKLHTTIVHVSHTYVCIRGNKKKTAQLVASVQHISIRFP